MTRAIQIVIDLLLHLLISNCFYMLTAILELFITVYHVAFIIQTLQSLNYVSEKTQFVPSLSMRFIPLLLYPIPCLDAGLSTLFCEGPVSGLYCSFNACWYQYNT